MTETRLREDTQIKEARKAFPDFDKLLLRIGYAPMTRMLMSMSKPDNLTISTVARASGLTEIEIGLLLKELNDRLIPYQPRVVKAPAKAASTATATKKASRPKKAVRPTKGVKKPKAKKKASK